MLAASAFSISTEIFNKIITTSFSAGLCKPCAQWCLFQSWDPCNHTLYRCYSRHFERNIIQSCLKIHLIIKVTKIIFEICNHIGSMFCLYLLELVITEACRFTEFTDTHHAAFKLCNIPHLSSRLEISCYCHSASTKNSAGYCNGKHFCISFPQPLTSIYKSSLLLPQPCHKITHSHGSFLMENEILHHPPSCSETLNIYLVQNEGGWIFSILPLLSTGAIHGEKQRMAFLIDFYPINHN